MKSGQCKICEGFFSSKYLDNRYMCGRCNRNISTHFVVDNNDHPYGDRIIDFERRLCRVEKLLDVYVAKVDNVEYMLKRVLLKVYCVNDEISKTTS